MVQTKNKTKARSLKEFLADWYDEKVWDNDCVITDEFFCINYNTDCGGEGEEREAMISLEEIEAADLGFQITIAFGIAHLREIVTV